MSMIGRTLGNFECAALLGKGGMGEVYQAKDRKLGRDVAIKVLPEEFARDRDRLARFQREAKLLASLNHPNIAAIHGLEESDGIHFLVLELVEGDTLADRLKRGVIPVEETLKLALQIVEALEAAHAKGVIHRDLKPANIKVTPEGKVKVLDFGLAKAYAGDSDDVNLSNSPTLSAAATQQGVILGTAAYMSPEQARGKSVDVKADIWAFGCVLFEMLAGRSAFSGKDVTDILAAVIRSEPEWSSLPANLHWRLKELLERCLEKEARDRYGSISDARVEIQKVLADPSGVFAQPDIIAKPRKRLRLGIPWIAAIAIFALIVGGLLIWYLKPAEPHRVTRFHYELPEEQQFGGLSAPALAVSPDGTQLVYGTKEGLYVRSMDQMDAKIIPGSGENPENPFFSPDGQWVGYVAGNQLKKIHINGGAPVTLVNPAVPLGYLDWTRDDTIVFCQAGTGILRVSANGGNPETIAKAENAVVVSAQMLPDGKSVLFTRVGPQPGRTIMVQSFQTGEIKELFAGDNARYIPTGHIIYAIDNDLFAVPFDPDKLEAIGGPVSVIEDVYLGMDPQYAVSNSGTLVYIQGRASEAGSASTLVWVDRNGKEEPVAVPPDLYSNPKISPDGGRVALTVGSLQNADIKIWDLVRKNLTRLTFAAETDQVPLWSPDGERIAFLSGREGTGRIYWKAADGTGKAEPLGSGYSVGSYPLPSSWSADGKTLAVMTINLSEMSYDIGVQPMEGEQKYEPLLKESYYESEPKISPDGQWMAYTSDESNKLEIYVRPFPDVASGRWQVSTDGGGSPLWAPDGRELFYLNGDAVMAVSVKTEPTFSPESPRMLFQGTYDSTAQHRNPLYLNSWDISPDGKRFLMIKPAAEAGDESTGGGPRKINIVLNWFEELKKRVPLK